ncbi:SgcJ/EcaC family oxidoreductase [Mycobacterium sp.]|uniref:SgcJ/EcaC family oxidoreductase n=1 Tax=Mycobacterium sp. TaxID=1785 RepID=UPI0025F496AC|nr:SgcJ/EcaC family oxidoreductase [Mycobacterium sp.]
MTHRPALGTPEHLAEATRAVENMVSALQRGLDEHDADIYNAGFSADVVWGGPFGATVHGYDTLHNIHRTLLARATAGLSRYEILKVSAPGPNVALAQVRRTPLDPADHFAEMALYVLVQRAGRWWLAAGQNTPIQPGDSATDRN